jgi:hypothetical protein
VKTNAESTLLIRSATPADAAAICAIYNPYIADIDPAAEI